MCDLRPECNRRRVPRTVGSAPRQPHIYNGRVRGARGFASLLYCFSFLLGLKLAKLHVFGLTLSLFFFFIVFQILEIRFFIGHSSDKAMRRSLTDGNTSRGAKRRQLHPRITSSITANLHLGPLHIPLPSLSCWHRHVHHRSLGHDVDCLLYCSLVSLILSTKRRGFVLPALPMPSKPSRYSSATMWPCPVWERETRRSTCRF